MYWAHHGGEDMAIGRENVGRGARNCLITFHPYTGERGVEKREREEKTGSTARLKTFKVYPQWHTSLSKAPPRKSPIPSETALPTHGGIQMLEHMEAVSHANHHTKEDSGLLSFDRLSSDCETTRCFWVIFFSEPFPTNASLAQWGEPGLRKSALSAAAPTLPVPLLTDVCRWTQMHAWLCLCGVLPGITLDSGRQDFQNLFLL